MKFHENFFQISLNFPKVPYNFPKIFFQFLLNYSQGFEKSFHVSPKVLQIFVIGTSTDQGRMIKPSYKKMKACENISSSISCFCFTKPVIRRYHFRWNQQSSIIAPTWENKL